jgi:hypothetical protein
MIAMRLSLLLVCVPLVAHGDATPPGKSAPAMPAAAESRRVLEYWIESGAATAHCAPKTESGCDLRPLELVVGGASVAVGFDVNDFKIHVRVGGGGELVLEAAGQGYLSRKGGNVTAQLVDGVAPVPLLKLASRPEACADFWEIYVSVVDGVPRKALELFGVADPPAMMSSTVKFARNDAVVTTRTTEDEGGHTRVKRVRYRWNGTVYAQIVPTSKRAPSVSK